MKHLTFNIAACGTVALQESARKEEEAGALYDLQPSIHDELGLPRNQEVVDVPHGVYVGIEDVQQVFEPGKASWLRSSRKVSVAAEDIEGSALHSPAEVQAHEARGTEGIGSPKPLGKLFYEIVIMELSEAVIMVSGHKEEALIGYRAEQLRSIAILLLGREETPVHASIIEAAVGTIRDYGIAVVAHADPEAFFGAMDVADSISKAFIVHVGMPNVHVAQEDDLDEIVSR